MFHKLTSNQRLVSVDSLALLRLLKLIFNEVFDSTLKPHFTDSCPRICLEILTFVSQFDHLRQLIVKWPFEP